MVLVQGLVSRETSPTDGAVVTVSRYHFRIGHHSIYVVGWRGCVKEVDYSRLSPFRFNTGPGASNVIPDSVDIKGTVRALTQVRGYAKMEKRGTRRCPVIANVSPVLRAIYMA